MGLRLAAFLTFVLTGVAGWLTLGEKVDDAGREIIFEDRSKFPIREVRECLGIDYGLGGFGHFKRLYVHDDGMGGEDEFYSNEEQERLRLSPSRVGTLVSFSAVSPPSPEDFDRLQWCVDRPNTTWIPQPNRSMGD